MAQQSMVLSQEQRLQMVLAPQLRQSLEMLQLPVLELRSLIQQELEKNPTLEEIPNKTTTIEIESGDGQREEIRSLDFNEDFKVLARLDEEWRDYFFQEEAVRQYTPQDAEKRQFFLDSLPQRESLQERLMRQLELSGLSEADTRIGELLVGSINDDGYLTVSVEELAAGSGLDPAHVRDVIAVIQDFSPTGVGARDLRECLLLQLDRLGKGDGLAAAIVKDHLEALGARKTQDIAKALS
jgi:RNA polymerase sigma-54 factor